MTCPFYVCDGRPSCLLGEPDGRHCGSRQYPASACNLDEIGRGEAWRAVVIDILHRVAYEEGKIGYESWWPSVAIIRTELAAVGWSP